MALAACGGADEQAQPPVFESVTLTTAEDTPLTLSLAISDTDTEALTITIVEPPVHGALSGTLPAGTYTPDANYFGNDSFKLTVSDGVQSVTGTVTINVTPVNDAPVAIDDTATTTEETTLEIPTATLIANDTDVEGDALTVTAVGTPSSGQATLGAGVVVYIPDPDFSGTATFTYEISDGTATTSAVVTVTVVDEDDAPVANADTATTAEDTALVMAAATLLANDTDGDGDPLTVTAVSGATNGTVALAGGNVTFTPTANFNGAASFEYTITDGTSTDTATVAVTVTSVEDLPVAGNDTATTNEDTPLVLAAATLLANDSDADGDELTITAVDNAVNGTVALAAGSVTFTPGAEFSGTASFRYTVSDGDDTTTATVTITVVEVNDAPVAVNDARTTAEDTALVITAASLLANDTDSDSGTLTVTAVGSAVNGTVTRSGTNITFTPTANFNGAASFIYTVSDGLLSDTAIVNITVTPVNDPPVANDDTATTNEDTPIFLSGATLRANDTDIDTPSVNLVVTQVSAAVNGTATISGGNVTFTPAANFNGTASFVYTLRDGSLTDTATVTITVVPVNDAPVAVDDARTTNEDVALVLVANLLAINDTDVDGDSLTVTAVGAPVNGTVALVAGTITFTPTANYNGPASFTYTVSDGEDTDTGTVDITIEPVNDAPVAVDDTRSMNEDAVLTIVASTLTANDTDVDGDSLTVTAVSAPANGTVSLAAGTITFTPTANYSGPASFTYTVSDGSLTDTGTVNVTVVNVNDPPVANDDTRSLNEDGVLTITASTLTTNDTDPDGDTLTVTAVGTPVNGTVSFAAGTITFTPTADYNGPASFVYTVSDGTATDTASVNITIIPVNDAPVAVDDELHGLLGTTEIFDAAELLANDTDIDSATLTITSVDDGGAGFATLLPTPPGDPQQLQIVVPETLGDRPTFTYTVSDGQLSATATVTVVPGVVFESFEVPPIEGFPYEAWSFTNNGQELWTVAANGDVFTADGVYFDYSTFSDDTWRNLSNIPSFGPIRPTHGDLAAVLLVHLTGRHVMTRTIEIPQDAVDICWDMEFLSHDPNVQLGAGQSIAVRLLDAETGAQLDTLYISAAGDPNTFPMTRFTRDVSAFAGQTVTLQIDADITEWWLSAAFDNFRFE